LEKLLDKKYPKYKVDEGVQFIQDIQKIIRDRTVEFVGKGTLEKGGEVYNIFRGNGLTVILKASGEWVTLLQSGTGMDLKILFVQ